MPVLQAKLTAGVGVRIVTKQVSKDDDKTQKVIADIERSGVTVDQRRMLHEKLAIIDGHTLWQGSLNIFSHRNTSEVMFRIPSAQACAEMMRFVSCSFMTQDDAEESTVFSEPENPECPDCGNSTVMNFAHGKPFFFCAAGCPGKVEKWSSGKVIKKGDGGGAEVQTGNGSHGTCPKCGGKLVVKNSRYGPFLSCGNFPKCKYKKNIKSKNGKTTHKKAAGNRSGSYYGKCSRCGAPMALRNGSRGPFLGCTQYPGCKFTKDAPKSAHG